MLRVYTLYLQAEEAQKQLKFTEKTSKETSLKLSQVMLA